MANKLTKLALAINIAMCSTSISAQSIERGVDQQGESVEKIIVTGSRIGRISEVAPTPVTVIDSSSITASGVSNVSDLLKELPALALSTTSQNSVNDTTGSSLLNLRGMGANRTLVLVDGKRHVAGSAGSSAVDINTIPVAFIERVEIITGGASAIYGADAVTGVVNFILKKDIEDFTVRGQVSNADDNDFSRKFLSFTGGSEFNDGKGQIAFAAEYAKQNHLYASERKSTRTSYSLVPNPLNGATDEQGNPLPGAEFEKIYTSGARLFVQDRNSTFFAPSGRYVFNDDGSVKKANDGTFLYGVWCKDCDGFDPRGEEDLQPETKRLTFNTKLNYALNDDINLYASAKYSSTKAYTTSQVNYITSAFNIPAFVTRDNAYVQADLAKVMDDNGLPVISLNRANTDFYVDAGAVDNTTESLVFGSEGGFATDWEFDTYISYGKTSGETSNNNVLLTERVAAAADAVKDANGNIVCRSSIDPNTTVSEFGRTGCTPANFMGQGGTSDEALAWFSQNTLSKTSIKQLVVSGYLSNSSLLELPAGDVAFVAGLEYRKEKSQYTPDALISAGVTELTTAVAQTGEYTVKEVFSELSIPVLSEVTGVKSLFFDAAARYSDYDSIGGALTWKLGLDWSIDDNVKVRATLSEAVRAPNISELYDAQSETTYNVSDPCDKTYLKDAEDPAIRTANCQALGLVDFLSENDGGSREALSGGNPELIEETSRSTTIGLVLTPQAVDNLSLTLDYWDIEISDVITALQARTVLNRCVDDPSGIDNDFCSLISRDATGNISGLTITQQNLSLKKARGIDFNAFYSFDALAGTFSTSLVGTYMLTRDDFPFQNTPGKKERQLGGVGNPELSGSITFGYSQDDFSLGWKTRYIDNARLGSYEILQKNPNAREVNDTGSKVYHDFNVSYHLNDQINVTAGIDNVFDTDRPFMLSGKNFDVVSGGYDNIGRNFRAGISYQF